MFTPLAMEGLTQREKCNRPNPRRSWRRRRRRRTKKWITSSRLSCLLGERTTTTTTTTGMTTMLVTEPWRKKKRRRRRKRRNSSSSCLLKAFEDAAASLSRLHLLAAVTLVLVRTSCSASVPDNSSTTITTTRPVDRTQGGEEEWLGHPENLTVVKTSPTSVRILWGLRRREDTKYLITYKPVSARYPVISEVVAPERSAVLERLLPYTQYQLYLTTIVNDSVQWTSPVISFHTTTSTTAFDDSDDGSFTSEADAQRQAKDEVEVPEKVGAMQVKAEEIGIVLLVLAMWMFAIALFFNRWGKIRMLEPYQEPYKEQANAQLGHRSSCPMADQYLMINKTMNLGSGDHCMYHTLRRPRQNSVFVGRTRSFSIGEHPPRKVKSALNLTTLVLQEAEEEGGPASSIV